MKIIKLSGLFCALVFFSSQLFSQINPPPRAINFTENFGTTGFTTLPSGFAAWNGLNGNSLDTQAEAESSVPTGNATVGSRATTTGTGGSYGYGPTGMMDASFYIQTSGNNGDGANQLALGVNISGCVSPSSVVLRYDTALVNSNPRTVGVVSQYRLGTTGAWTTIFPVSFNSASSQIAYSVASELPPAVLNQPNVQIRWATWRGSDAGNSSGADIDNVSVNCEIITATPATVGGRVTDKNGNGLSNVRVKISGVELSEPVFALTNPFGYFNFEVQSGQTYAVTVSSKSHTFSNPTRLINVNDNVSDLNFIADER